ncbi:MAG: ABC transporter permease [Desulfurococcaceae archaeon]
MLLPTYYSRIIYRNLKKTRFKIGVGISTIIVVLAVIAPLIAPYPDEGYGYIPADAGERKLVPPSIEHIFGTDALGRDLFSRVIIGTRTAVIQAVSVIFISLIIGMLIGVCAAYFKGIIEITLNYFIELFMAIPSIVIALFLRLTIGQGLHVVIASLVITWWAWYARISYVYAKSVVELEYVVLAKLSGLSALKIIPRHVIRNIFQALTVQAISDLGSALLEASAINFMGLGLPSGSPEWGVILYEAITERGIEAFLRSPWLVVFPGILILVTTLGFSLVADPLREDLDPRLRRRWKLWF